MVVRGLAIILSLAICPLPGLASVPLNPATVKPWDELVRQLESSGVGSDTKSVITAALSHPDTGTRWIAINLLELRRDEGAEEALERIAASDPDQQIRGRAALALVRLGHDEFIEDVRKVMASSELLSDQLYLAGHLAEFKDTSGYEFVEQATRSTTESLRIQSAGALRRFLPMQDEWTLELSSPQDLLLRLLRDPSARVRKEAVIQVGIALSESVPISPLVEALTRIGDDDPNPDVRKAAQRELRFGRLNLDRPPE